MAGVRKAVEPGFEDLFRHHYPRLVRALALAAGPEEAADAVQEAFIAAHRHWKRISGYDDPAGWVRRVAVNRLSNRRRSLGRRDRAVRRLGGERLGPDRPAADLDLAAAVAALPQGQRLAVGLFYLADLPVAEVAEAMGITAGTVKSQLHDARRSLAAHLEVFDDA